MMNVTQIHAFRAIFSTPNFVCKHFDLINIWMDANTLIANEIHVGLDTVRSVINKIPNDYGTSIFAPLLARITNLFT